MKTFRGRILALLVPATAGALVVTAVGIDQAVRRDLQGALDRTLLARARGVASGIWVSVDGTFEFEPGAEIEAEIGSGREDGFYAVAERDGRRRVASPGAPALAPPALEDDALCHTRSIAGRSFRVCGVWVDRHPETDEEDVERWQDEHPGEPLPQPQVHRFWVTVGQGTRALDQALSSLRTRLAAGFALLLAVLVFLPLAVVRRGLAPLRQLSAQADRVGPDAPSTRLDETFVGAEVHGLVAALNRALDRLAGAYERQRRFTADAAH